MVEEVRGTYDAYWQEHLGMPSAERIQSDMDAEKSLNNEGLELASYNRDEMLKLCETDLNMLAAVAMPTVFQYEFPTVLVSAWGILTSLSTKIRDFSKLALGIPRGHAKTTIIKLFILYCILFTKKKFILVIAETATKAENIIADVVDMLNENNIVSLFGSWKIGIEKDTQDTKKFGFRGRNIIIAAIGVGGSLRGMNLKNERPDVMVFDDIQSAEIAESQVQSDMIERWMIGTAMKAKSPHGCLYIYAGNMFRTQWSILKKLKKNPTWIKFISGAILADGTALWEELRPLNGLYDEFADDLAAGHPEIFFAEVMNDTEVAVNTKVNLATLREWKWLDTEQPQGKFIIIDPASGKLGRDDVAIGYFEVFDAIPAMRDLREESMSPGNTIRAALLLALKYGCRCIVVESTAYQSTLLYWFGVVCQQLGIEMGDTGIQLLEIHSGNSSKNFRITKMLAALTAGEIILHPCVRSQVVSEIGEWNPLKKNNKDGILDLLAYAPEVIEKYEPLLATEQMILVGESALPAMVEGQSWAF